MKRIKASKESVEQCIKNAALNTNDVKQKSEEIRKFIDDEIIEKLKKDTRTKL